jgi:hypothetical protein
MQAPAGHDGDNWVHHIFSVHIWQQPDHVDRLRALRTLSPDDDVRQAAAAYLGELVEGEGEMEGIWVAEVH